ncbi:MAG TPA: hypothetical protein VM490_20840 [Armatimonadaceae bacterium]|nr:hypothetical protein [Armatimonadaceae bacterium]
MMRRFGRNSGLALRAAGALLLLAAPAAYTLSGCGGSMSSSATAWQMTGTSLSPSRALVGQNVAVSTEYQVVVPNVNENFFPVQQGGGTTGGTGGGQQQQVAQVGTFSARWTEVPPPGQAPILQIDNGVGITDTSVSGSSAPDAVLLGASGVSVRAIGSGTTTLRLRVTLHYSDGSTDTEEFLIPLTVEAGETTGI